MHPNTNHSWHVDQCARVSTFAELSEKVALPELRKFGPGGARIICGPISTGGRGTLEENLSVFNRVIFYHKKKMMIFDQGPYEDAIVRLRNMWRAEDPARKDEYCWPVIHDFYAPLFETGLIVGGIFIHGWESSQGAKWEHQTLRRLGKEITYLSKEELEHILASLP